MEKMSNSFIYSYLWIFYIIRLCLMLAGISWAHVITVHATDRYVVPPGTAGGTNAGAFTNWTIAATQIQWAIDAAAVDDMVWVSNGVYVVTNEITLTNRITVKGLNGWSNTLVAADWPAFTTRCFYLTRTGVVDGLTISNGHYMVSNNYNGGGGAYLTNNAKILNCYLVNNVCSNAGTWGGGGGVYMNGSGIVSNSFVISNMCYKVAGSSDDSALGGGIFVSGNGQIIKSTIISNTSISYGGGIYARSGTTISNCYIAHNVSSRLGGGVFQNGALTINCVISNNQTSASPGGGVAMWGTAVRDSVIVNNIATIAGGGGIWLDYAGLVSNCVIAGNSCLSDGGGIYAAGRAGYDIIINACRISNNICTGSAGRGGGVEINNGQLRNSLVYNNTNLSGVNGGGGIYLNNSAKYTNQAYGLINCTIVNNYSTNEGGGIATYGPSNYIANCIFAGNGSFSNNYPDVYNTEANSNNYFYSCATNTVFAPNQGNITNDPLFVNAASGNWRLSPNSPCVNTGTNMGWMTNAVDLDGKTRIRYDTVDMGAYERIYSGAIFSIR